MGETVWSQPAKRPPGAVSSTYNVHGCPVTTSVPPSASPPPPQSQAWLDGACPFPECLLKGESSPDLLSPDSGRLRSHIHPASAPVDFLRSIPVSSQQTGTIGHVSSEERLGILSWGKDVASENWQVHSKVGVKLRITQVTFWTIIGLMAISETQINENSGNTELYH